MDRRPGYRPHPATVYRWRAKQAEQDAERLRDAIRTYADRIERIPDGMSGRAMLVKLAAEMRTIAAAAENPR